MDLNSALCFYPEPVKVSVVQSYQFYKDTNTRLRIQFRIRISEKIRSRVVFLTVGSGLFPKVTSESGSNKAWASNNINSSKIKLKRISRELILILKLVIRIRANFWRARYLCPKRRLCRVRALPPRPTPYPLRITTFYESQVLLWYVYYMVTQK